ncbi:hypothetical protein BTA51_23615 [Hahella sp. CCB-MM4]|uniref:tandem-95 repeat protein n=1 Tax=Hahella sp. (strain CCB-MM4) TaxID=1926491 RepID=UPI000B9B03CA|nr:tandem-95 repeat protein [Hahella sp. CCB-MM4]OZG70831.1 hypothetical protein BTA51_23615 [Hahella sp. CCB-MM4]
MNNRVFNGLLTFLLPMSALAGTGYGGSYLRSAGYGGYGKPRSVLVKELARHPSQGSVKPKPQHEKSGETGTLELFQGQTVNELVILDGAVKDRSALYKGLKPGVQMVEIDPGESGLEQLKKVLSHYSDLAAVHIVSHASDGQVMLGRDTLTAEKLHDEITLFNALNHAIREGGDLLFYGCDLASGEKGEALLELISGNTHVDVAASNDLTGAENLGGDWDLEIQHGQIEAQQPFDEIALKDFSSVLAPEQYVTSNFCTSSCYNSSSSHTSSDGDLVFTGEASGSAENVYAYSAGRAEGGFYLSYQTSSSNDGDTSGALVFSADNVNVYSFELTALVYSANGGYSCSGGSIVGYKAGGGTVTDTITWSGYTNSATLTNLSGVQITHFKVNGSGCSPAVYEVMGVKSFTVDNKQAPNTAPSISNLDSDSVAWAGVGSTVTLDSGGDATVSDTELDALNGGNGDYSGGSLTVQRPSAVTSDVFGFDTSGALFTVNGSDLQDAGQTFASFTNTNGVLTITFNSSSTAATTALVQDVTRRITYRNDTPAGDATVRFTLSDGTSTDTADVTVTSDTIYITNTTDTASIDATDGVSFSEAIAIAAADGSGTQTLIVDSSLAGQTVSASSASSLSESLTLDLGEATGMTLSGGSLSLGGGVTLTLDNDTGDTASISTAFGGTGALAKTSDGTVTLTGSQSYSGTTTFTGGTVSVAGDSNLGSGQLIFNGGTLSATSSGTINNAFNVAADSTINHSTNLVLSGLMSGSQNLTVSGSGELQFTNTGNEASSSAGITITSGTVWTDNDDVFPSGTITLDGGNFASNGSSGTSTTIDNNFAMGASGGSFDIYGGGGNYSLILTGVVSGSGNLTKTVASKLSLTGTNTWTGTTTIKAGQIVIADDSNLGSGEVIFTNGTLTVTGSSVTIDNNVTMSSGGTVSNANDISLSGVISGSGTLTKSGAGTLTLSGTQTQTGGTNVTAGGVSIAGDTNIGSGTITLNGGNLTVTGTGTIDNAISIGSSNGTITNANAVTLSGVMSGTGSPTKAGAGTLTLSGTNSNSGLFNVSAGTVAVSGTVSSLVTVSSGATLEGAGVFASLVVVNSGGTIQVGSSPGTMTLASGFTLNSGGTLVARINGTTAGTTYDQYDVSGTVTLGGTLSVIGSHSGSGGDSFVIINNDASDSVSSTFNGLSEGDATTTLNGKPLTVSYLGSTGNDVTLSIVPPTITAGNISISGASGTGGAYIIGDTVTASWNDTGAGDNNGDITSVTVDFSQFGGGSTVAASNSSNTWTATYTLVSGSVDNTNRNVSVTATDTDGVSGTTADTTNATVDNIAPTISDSNLSITGSSGTSGTYIIGDTVTATWNDTSGGDNNTDTISGVTVDFSSFGGGASVAASNSSDTWTATYTITSGAIDSSNLNVSATATDNAGNTNLANDSTNATVDNQAPTVTDANISISGASGTGGTYIVGDTVIATWNDTGGGDNNSDTISSVTVNFSSFGGGSAVAASNSSDTWTATYTITAGSIEASNLNVSVTATDNGGNATTTSDGTNATVDNQAPSGHSVSFDDSTINSTEASSQSFTFASGEVGADYSYSISSSGGGTNVTGSGTLATATDQITGLDLSGLGDGTLTLSVTLTDSTGNSASAVTDTATLDTIAASGHSVAFDDSSINSTEASSQSFTFTGGEIGADYSYTISSSGGGTNVTGSGTLATATDQISSLDLSGLGDGTLTLSVVVTDTAGNAASAVTDTATLDTTAASGHSVSFDDTAVNSSEASSQSFTFAAGEVGADFSYTISSSGGGTNVTGSGTLATATDQVTGLDLSGLGDGTLTLSVVVTDSFGNAATAVTDTATLDTTAPSGQSVSFDDATINGTEASSQSFTFAGGEVGADYDYTISSSGGGTDVTGSGTLATATDQITGINISGLSDGTLTLSVVLTDTAGNAATAVTDTAALDSVAPTLSSSSPADGSTTARYDTDLTLTFNESVAAGSSGDLAIAVYDADDDSLVESNDSDSAQVNISGTVLTVSLVANLDASHSYYVQVGADAVEDSSGNSYAGISDTTTLNFTTTNLAPTATNDSSSTNEDNAVAISVLDNDSDEDGSLNAASVTVTSGPSNGSTSVNTGTGVVTYTPDSDFNGSDSFTYTVEDNNSLASSAATVTITVNAVNDAPVAVADLASTAEDTAVSIDVASNDTDVDSGDAVDSSTITIVTGPADGSAIVNSGQVDYTPDADFNGSDSFTYTIEDGNGATSNTATVTINVTSVNDLPVATDDSATVDEDDSVVIDVVSNDSDVDGTVDATTVTVQTDAGSGSTSVDSVTGEITYTPSADFNGSDTFTYTVKDDSDGTSNAATVTITINSVNDAPVAVDDTATLLEDVAHTINVLGNDSDVDGTLDASTVEVVTAPDSGGTSVNTTTGAIIYTPDSDFNGEDSLTYRVQDDQGEWSAEATVTLTVQSVNDAPLANADSYSLNEDTPTVLDILDNDSDVDGTIDVTSISILTDVSDGSLSDNGDGTLTYTPDANFYGSDSFTYMVADDSGDDSDVVTVTITVNPVNDAPTISGTPTASLVQGENYSFTPTLDDVEGDTLSVSAANLPSWLSLNTDTGAITGTASVAGTFSSIVLTVTDGSSNTALAAFSIEVELDTDGDGEADSVDTDDDNDGMSDEYELNVGLDPLDSSDADGDLDGDTISNYQESVDGTDPTDEEDYVDTTAPVVVAPDELVLDAVALYTPVTVRQLLDLPASATDAQVASIMAVLASDNVDGDSCCNTQVQALLNGSVLLPPGRNLVTYRAVDHKGNVGTALQVVNIRPLVSVNKDQVSVEGATVLFKVILNGQSPFYPLTIPYVIGSNSTADSSDHDLVNGSVTLTKPANIGQTEASVSINLISDGVSESDEILIVKLDDRTTNAEDLANGYNESDPDIYDINSGAKTFHKITIVERNVAPEVSLQLTQGGTGTIQVTKGGGPVTIKATIVDPNVSDTHRYNWAASDGSLVDTDGNLTNRNLVFSPSGLSVGRYMGQVTVTDSAGATDTARLYFRVVQALPVLQSDVDSDGDGTSDADEGTADTDDDGIPEYLDNIDATNVLPEVASETASYLVECDPGVRCRLGQFALLGNSGGARLDDDDIEEQDDLSSDRLFDNVGGLFDFEIHELPTIGQSVSVVLPQQAAIPANSIYRKFQNGEWMTFVEDDNNLLHSAAGNPGYCPPPGDDSWEVGLITGYYCVQLTIEDGGPNDADGLANGSVEDPGGVSVDSRTSSTITSTGGGSGGGAVHWVTLLTMFVGLMLLNRSRYGKGTTLALFLMVGMLPAPKSQAWEWDAVKDKVYLELGAYRASGSQDASSFSSGLESADIDVTLNTYDTTRLAFHLVAGYQYQDMMALEIGFLDLGDVDVDLDALSPSDEELSQAVEKHYPVSGNGWTVANRFLWDVHPQVTLSGEVGLFLWDGDIQLSGADINPDLDGGTDPLLGLGAGYQVMDNIDVLLRIKRVFMDHQHVDLLGIGGAYRF